MSACRLHERLQLVIGFALIGLVVSEKLILGSAQYLLLHFLLLLLQNVLAMDRQAQVEAGMANQQQDLSIHIPLQRLLHPHGYHECVREDAPRHTQTQ